MTGLIGLGVAIALGVWLVVSDPPDWTRLFVALPLGFGLLGVLQARAGT